MTLQGELKRQGDWLFRWRSYLPLIILPILLAALRHSGYIELALGDMANDLWKIICIMVSFTGLAVRCNTVGYTPRGTSGRTTSGQEASTLNTTGIYSIVRHPLYMGNFLIIMGIALFVQIWWFVLVVFLAFWLYYERIIFAEEEFLQRKFGSSFLDWAERTPAFIPRLKNRLPPELPFSFKNVLKREYSGFFGIVASFTFMDVVRDVFENGKPSIELEWLAFFNTGLFVYLALRLLKKKTNILNVEGR